MGGKSKHAENKKICRPFSFSTQDINPELGTLGHILVTAIIFSVAAVRKNNAANRKRKLIAAVILFFVSAAISAHIFAE